MNLLASINNNTNLATSIVLIVVLALLTIAVVLVGVYLIGKYRRVPAEESLAVGRANGGKLKTGHLFLIILGVGVVLRLIFTFLIKGFYSSFENEYNIVNWIFTNGYEGLYANGNFDGNLSSPLMTYVYFITVGLGKAIGLDVSSVMMSFFVKIPYILADIAVAVALYKFASKHINKYVGVVISAMFIICPIFMVMSSVWGSPYSLYMAVLFFAVYFLLKRNIPMMAVFATLLFSLLPESVFLAPLFLGYMGYLFVKAIMTIVKDKPSFDTAVSDKNTKSVIEVPVCIIMSVCAIYLIALPAYFSLTTNFFEIYKYLFIAPIETVGFFSQNALNIFSVFGQNYVSLGANAFPSLVFGILFFLVVLAVVLIVFLTNRNRANLVLVAAFIVMTVSTYFIGTNEWTIVPSLVLLLLAFIIIQDKRILKVFAMFSLTTVVNVLFAMMYSNNLSFAVSASTVSSSMLTFENAPVGFVFSIVLSVITVLSHIYYTVVMLDISMAKHRKLMPDEASNMTFTESMISWMFNR